MITNAISEGGVESLLFDLSRRLVTLKHRVTILVLNKREIGLKQQFEKCGITIIVGKYTQIYNPLNILLIRKHIPDFQIIHVHLYPGQLFVALANLLCTSTKCRPLITTEHSTFNNRRKYQLFKILDSYMYSKYDEVICISKQTELNLRKWLSKQIKADIRTIINGIDLEKFHQASNKLMQYLKGQYESDIQYIVMVGRFDYPKDQQTVINAMTYLSDKVHLILVGTGSTLQQCKEFVNKEKLQGRIHFFGNCKDIPSILKGCRLGILSTHWDGFGLVAVEYMAAGIPVLASDVDGLRDIVGKKELLFGTGDVRGLRDKILWLLKDSNAYREMASYSIANSQNYTIDKMVLEYMDAYRNILK